LTVKTTFKRGRLTWHPRLVGARILRSWPLAIWLAAAIAAAALYSKHARFGGMTGVLMTVAEPVAPLATARLVSLAVERGEPVKAGQLLATMDTSLVDAAIAIDEARLLEAEGAIAGYQQNILVLLHDFDKAVTDAEERIAEAKERQQDMVRLLRQSDAAVLSAEIKLLDLAAEEKRDMAELAELQAELQRRETLLSKRLTDEQNARELRPAIAALSPTVAAYPSLRDALKRQLEASQRQRDGIKDSLEAFPELMKTHEKRLAEASQKRDEARKWLRLADDEDASAAIQRKMATRSAILKANNARLALKRNAYVLRATRDGVVSRIFHEAGDVIAAGEPILRLVGQRSNRIVGFLPEIHLTDLSVGQEVSVWRGTGSGAKVTAVVRSIAPEVQSLPGRVSPIPGEPLRGRRVILSIVNDHDFVPGETVQVRAEGADWLNLDGLLARLSGANAWRSNGADAASGGK
jgi:multidrug resistance efflux pump